MGHHFPALSRLRFRAANPIFAPKRKPLRTALLFVVTLFSLHLGAQGHRYQFDLELLPTEKAISGKARFTFVNHSNQPLHSLVLHLPPRSLSYKKSFLNRQFNEFQDVDLHFADKEETGYIELTEVQAGGAPLAPLCEDCEFANIPLGAVLQPGDSLPLDFRFYLRLPEAHWIGVGFDKKTYRIIDWLPQFAPLDSARFHPYPVTWQRDVYPSENRYRVRWLLPKGLETATNASLISSSDADNIQVYRHTGTNLQFVFSDQFYKFPLQNGGTLYTLRPDPFIPEITDTLNLRTARFLKNELGEDPLPRFDLLLLEDKVTEYQSDRLITLNYPKDGFDLAKSLVQAKAEALFRYRLTPDGFRHVWLARGIPYFYKYLFIKEFYPDENWVPFSNTLLGRIFSLDEFDYGYQNQFLYLFLARQGLDQKIATPADSLTRLNYEAVAQGKAYLALNHFRGYTSAPNFKRAMRQYWQKSMERPASPASLKKSFQYFVNRDVNWFFEDWLHSDKAYDYRLKKFDHCPTISTATVQNKGALNLPYSLTGFKDGKPVLTEWFPGHDTARTVQMYHEDYDKVVLNYEERNGEFNQKNNSFYNRWLWPHTEPLHLQFYQSFEDPAHTQLFYLPTVGYNDYDKLLLGLAIYNGTLVNRNWEFVLGPEYSTGQEQLTGYASLTRNIIPQGNRIFNRITGGVYGRYYHYDRNLAYYRLSPGFNFYFRKPFPRSSILQKLRVRTVHVKRELDQSFDGVANAVSNASYSVLNLTYTFEETHILKPYTLKADFMLGDQFSRLGLTGDFRWMLPNKRWLIWRNFGGIFFSNRFANIGRDRNYYSLGLSGTQDFLFDHNFIGRSNETGIWSRQFFTTDGGFKSATGVFADRFMLSTNLSVPVWKFFGVFGDAGVADGFNTIYCDYGLRLAFLTDFLEVYLPLGNQDGLVRPENYGNEIRFVLDLDLSNIIHRLRRGYY